MVKKTGWQEYSDYLHHGLYAIRRRLGAQKSRGVNPIT